MACEGERGEEEGALESFTQTHNIAATRCRRHQKTEGHQAWQRNTTSSQKYSRVRRTHPASPAPRVHDGLTSASILRTERSEAFNDRTVAFDRQD